MSEFTYHIPPPCSEEAETLFADDHILVVSKPAGLLSVPGRFLKDCLLQRVMYDYPDAVIVHRLDLDTSGLMVLALSRLAVSDLNRQFRERLVQKQYAARVKGSPPAQGEISLALRPDPDHRPRQMVDEVNGKPACTRYRVLETDQGSADVCLQPVTGRSHQLRIHMAAIGHPILGCDLYADEESLAASDRLMLHAQHLGFSHPATGESLSYTSPVPWT